MNQRINWTSPAAWVAIVGLALWAVVLVATVSQVNQPFPGFRVGYCRTVSDFNEPRWTGIRAGLRSADAIIAVDGRPVESGRAIIAHSRAVAVGTPVRYDIVREGKPQTLTVPTQVFGLGDFLLSFGVFFAVGLVMLFIGAAAALAKPNNPAARANLVLSTGMALTFVFSNDYDLAQLFHPALYFAAVLLYASGALAMAFTFPDASTWARRWPWTRALPSATGGILLAGVLGAFITQGQTPDAEALAASVFLWPTVVLVISGATFARRLWRTRVPDHRLQLLAILWGMAVAYLPVMILDKAPRLLAGQVPPPLLTNLAYAFWIAYPLALAYAIVKHRAFDIELIIKRTTVYASLTAFLVGGYFASAAFIRAVANALLGAGHASDWENVLATGIIVAAFGPVRALVTREVDRRFFRTDYDFRQVVATVSETAEGTLEIDELKRRFADEVELALRPRYMYILSKTAEGNGDLLTPQGDSAMRGATPEPFLKVPFDDPVLQRSIEEREMYVPKTGMTGLISQLALLGPHYPVPLQVGDEVVGLLILGPKLSDQEYTSDDRQLLGAIRGTLASAIKRATLLEDKLFKDRMEQELKRAREVQEAMLPRSLPAVSGFEFAASSLPCYEASGDYYDFVELPDGRWGVAVADVAGKGIAAAMATAMAKSGLYSQSQVDPEVIPVLTALNRLLHNVSKHAAAKSFTTCLYALLDPTGKRLTYSCAGHFPPIYYDSAADKVIEFPAAGGFPLGVREKSKYVAQEIQLHPGDVLVFFTDGVTEAQAPERPSDATVEPGEMFETDRLQALVAAHRHRSAHEIHQAIQEAVETFVEGGPQTDDITLVVLKVLSA
ncbi:Phosphoserine phosphatase RsbU [compost metagenome]